MKVKIETKTAINFRITIGELTLSISELGVAIYNGFSTGCFYRCLKSSNFVDDCLLPNSSQLKRYEIIGKLLTKY